MDCDSKSCEASTGLAGGSFSSPTSVDAFDVVLVSGGRVKDVVLSVLLEVLLLSLLCLFLWSSLVPLRMSPFSSWSEEPLFSLCSLEETRRNCLIVAGEFPKDMSRPNGCFGD